MTDFATQVALKLAEEIARLARGQKKMTPRSLLKRFGYARRGPQIVAAVNEALSRGGVVCTPPLGEVEGLDDLIVLTRVANADEVITANIAAPIAASPQPLSIASADNLESLESSARAESSTRFENGVAENFAPVATLSASAETATTDFSTIERTHEWTQVAPAEIETAPPIFAAPTLESPTLDAPNAVVLNDAPVIAPPLSAPAIVSAPPTAPILTPQQVLAYAQAATVLICTSDGHGSGFVVDRGGLIATARHVVGREEKVQVFFSDDTQVEGRVLASNATLDYAFLRVPPCKIGFRLRGETEAYAGQRVFAVGSPRDRKLAGSVTAGVISNTHRTEGGVEYLQTDTSISPGNSGGPLIAEDGMVVGMNVWGRTDGAGLNFALPAAYFAAALDILRPQLSALEKCVYCADCGFLNAPDRWIECRTWICCGNCGTQLGELNGQ